MAGGIFGGEVEAVAYAGADFVAESLDEGFREGDLRGVGGGAVEVGRSTGGAARVDLREDEGVQHDPDATVVVPVGGDGEAVVGCVGQSEGER